MDLLVNLPSDMLSALLGLLLLLTRPCMAPNCNSADVAGSLT